ncbi:MAG: aryl-sulfate sulfotransferase [Bdellovibrionales bacterium]|nr:aryl-sulfate sulfotransferase [Bdellovibrionales bacterium]
MLRSTLKNTWFQLIALTVAAVAFLYIIPHKPRHSGKVGRGEVSHHDSAQLRLGSTSTALDEEDLPADPFQIVSHESSRTTPGLTLVPLMKYDKIFLLNQTGRVLHSWSFDALRAELLPSCNLLVIHGSKLGKDKKPWSELRDVVREYDWNGQLVWEYKADSIVHHDFERLESGNTLLLKRADIDRLFEVEKDNQLVNELRRIRSDSILEVLPSGELAWAWHAHEHFDLSNCGRRECGKRYEERQVRDKVIDWTHSNTLNVVPENKWHRSGDLRFKPGNLIYIPRNFWTIYIIDKDSGQIVWEYARDKGMPEEDSSSELVRGHDAYMIPEGTPGAGNIIVLDNGIENYRTYSVIREIDPVAQTTVWRYMDKEDFFAPAGGSVQRLKNGNTLVSQDRRKGRVFEISQDGAIVWELQTHTFPARAQRYDFNYCKNLEQYQDTK